jgi:molybdenum cofactor synthesis domain-containing protein
MDRPTVVVLAIGNELLRGDVENSNARWLSVRLTARGAYVVHLAVVRDEEEHIEREFHQALTYAPSLLLTTGGLGPTADDLTLSAIARATHRPLEPNSVALAMVEGRYAELARGGTVASAELTPSRRKMGLLPRGAVPLANHVGTAPGVCLNLDALTVVCLPGVPRELYHIVETSLAPVLDRVLGTGVQREIVRFADTTDESRLADALAMVSTRHPHVYIKSHAAGFKVGGRFRITFSTLAADAADAERSLSQAERDLTDALRATGIHMGNDAAP